jgi:hypothetical protein
MATNWEETKRAAQSLYNAAGKGFDLLYSQTGFRGVYNDIGNAYQQLLIAGHIYPSMERNFPNTYEMVQNPEQEMEQEQPEVDKGFEPER